MPRYGRIGPYLLSFYSYDRAEPVHVHVRRDADEAKVWLGAEAGDERVAFNHGFSPRELRRVVGLVRTEREGIIRFWNTFFDL